MLVTMTHDDFPGREEEVEQVSYRYAYYPVGWRSADDPDWEGAGLTPPVPHASDASLHGGGQELDYAQITSATSALAVNVLTATAIPGLVVTVPDVERPVCLEAFGCLSHSVAGSNVALLLAPVGGSLATAIASAIAATTAGLARATPFVRKRLAPSTPGNYQAFVYSSITGTITVLAGPENPAWISATQV